MIKRMITRCITRCLVRGLLSILNINEMTIAVVAATVV